MTEVRFLFSDKVLTGFHIKGHSTSSGEDEQGRLVCSAISSAAYMVANTVTEVIGAKADVKVDDGEMLFVVKTKLFDVAPTLCGFKLHIDELSKQFTDYIKVISEV